MPVTTLSDLKDRRSAIAENIAWSKREMNIAATQYERARAEERLPGLTAEFTLVSEEIRQAEAARFRSVKTAGKVALVVVGVIAFGCLLS